MNTRYTKNVFVIYVLYGGTCYKLGAGDMCVYKCVCYVCITYKCVYNR